MDRSDLESIDPLYILFLLGSLTVLSRTAGIRLSMGLFVILVGITDWLESRHRQAERTGSAFVLTIPVLAVLWLCLVFTGDQLPAYFAVLGGAFFLQALRQVVVYDVTPIQLFRHGYPSLVAFSIVCSAFADGLLQFQPVLVGIFVGVFVFRKLLALWKVW